MSIVCRSYNTKKSHPIPTDVIPNDSDAFKADYIGWSAGKKTTGGKGQKTVSFFLKEKNKGHVEKKMKI